MATLDDKAGKSLQTAYTHNGIMYLQKNHDSYLFVAPGYPHLTKHVHEGVLVAAGAKKIKHYGWKRKATPIDKDNIPRYAIR